MSDPIEVVFPLSGKISFLLHQSSPDDADAHPDDFPNHLLSMIRKSPISSRKAHFRDKRWSSSVAAMQCFKAVRGLSDCTEYTTLLYLREHKPNIPVPEPLGLLRMSGILLIFMSCIPGSTLAAQWQGLSPTQKASELRSIPLPPPKPLCGVGGAGCKDVRRHLRRSDVPIMTCENFDAFLFSGRRPNGHVFLDLLREISPPVLSSTIIFTHGDIHHENIIVKMTENDGCITGFYPDYYEAVKCTNCLSLYEEDAWYLYLLGCVSLRNYPHW
ncbi:hypothetical protein BJY01DRAFT_238744 [Aspergillus pseudoustus]|uniref:Aminoglycoside phosphotransferase domain-containing protein n=1 Tax=Aspergillus pseudoustus TaxID=1810923 RepID=A0ABR4J699_9EURO